MYIDNVMVMIHSVEETLKEAEEYLWDINVPYIASSFPLIGQAFNRGIKGRFLHTKELEVPPSMMDERTRYIDSRAVERLRAMGAYEERIVDTQDVILYMSEKQVSIVSFPTQSGQFDFLGFTSKDKRTHEWCEDLFMHYWEKGNPRHLDV